MELRELEERIEVLRQQLHRSVPGTYEPAKLAAAAPISAELDRLIVEWTRRSMEPNREPNREPKMGQSKK